MEQTLAVRLRRCLEQNPVAIDGGHGQAAVMLAISDEPEPRLLLIRRSLNLSLHPGEIALPGGKLDPTDADLCAAALREAWEEVALPPDRFDHCGSLTPRFSMSGLNVTAFVGVVPAQLMLRANADEVDELIHVPMAYFAEPAHLRVDRVWRGGTLRLAARYQYADYTIWGMTAGFVVELVNRFYNAGINVATHVPGQRRVSAKGDTA